MYILFTAKKTAPGSDSTLKLNEICKKDEININLLVDLVNCYNDLS